MPIIFASSLLMFPSLLFNYLDKMFPGHPVINGLHEAFTRGHLLHL